MAAAVLPHSASRASVGFLRRHCALARLYTARRYVSGVYVEISVVRDQYRQCTLPKTEASLGEYALQGSNNKLSDTRIEISTKECKTANGGLGKRGIVGDGGGLYLQISASANA